MAVLEIKDFDRWQAQSLAWQEEQQAFRAYMDASANAHAEDERYRGKWLVGLLSASGPQAFVADLGADGNNYFARMADIERRRVQYRLIKPGGGC